MKTTIDMSDNIFREVKSLAYKKGVTMKEIIETSLRRFLENQKNRPKPFRLKNGAVGGKGLVEGLQEGDWPEIRRRIYEGRGG